LHDAFAAAVERWPSEGVPGNPPAWLVSTGRFKAIDGLRRRATFDASLGVLAEELAGSASAAPDVNDEGVDDDQLRLIFNMLPPGPPA